MFRTALRTSQRAAGAVAASSRISAVCTSTHPYASPPVEPIASRPPDRRRHISMATTFIWGAQWDGASLLGMALGQLRRASERGNTTPSFEAGSREKRANVGSSYRRATPPPLSTPSLAAMPPMLRPPPLRSPLSSSRGSAVSRRSPVSPRPAVSSPSGTQKQYNNNINGQHGLTGTQVMVSPVFTA
jgi:hypothetical protein